MMCVFAPIGVSVHGLAAERVRVAAFFLDEFFRVLRHIYAVLT